MSNKKLEFEIENTASFILAPKNVKCLGRNPTKYVEDIYEENHKTLKEI